MEDLSINDHILLAVVEVLHKQGLVNAQAIAEELERSALIQQVQPSTPSEADGLLKAAAKVMQQYADTLNQIHPWPVGSGKTE